MHKLDDPLGFFFFGKLQSVFIENKYIMKCIKRKRSFLQLVLFLCLLNLFFLSISQTVERQCLSTHNFFCRCGPASPNIYLCIF